MIQRRNSDLETEQLTRESNRLGEKDLDRIADDRWIRLGEDIDRRSQRTPDRATRALGFLTQGYRQNLDKIINGAVSSRGRVRSF
jgi:GTP cyclohydrolase I